MLEVAAHGAAGLVGITRGDGSEDGLMIFERGRLVLVESGPLAETVVHGGEHACPEAVHDAGEHTVASSFPDGYVELAVEDLRVGLGLDQLAHLLESFFDLGEVASGGVKRGVGGYLAFDEDAGAEKLEGAGTGVEHQRHWVDGLANIGAGAGADFEFASDLKGDHCLADGGAADTADLRQVNFAGETVSRLKTFFCDVAGDAGGDLLVAAVCLHDGR